MTRLSLRPGPRDGLEIAEARDWRIDATSNSGVVLREPGRPERVIASPGQVAKVVVLRNGQVPRRLQYYEAFDEVLVLRSDDRALLVVPLHLLAHGEVRDAAELRRVSGADEFAQALGLTLEPADDDDAAVAARADDAVVLRGPVRSTVRPVFWRHCALLAIATVALLGVINLSGDAALSAGFVGAAAVGLLAVDQWRFRGRFLDLVASRPTSPARVEIPNVLGAIRDHSARAASLQIGADDIVHKSGAGETWVAGPRLGGVVRCVRSDDGTIRFFDRRHAELLVVLADPWISPDGADSALESACRAAGIDYLRATSDVGGTSQPHVPVLSQAELGDFVIGGPLATSVIAFVLFLVHISPVDELDVPRAAVAVLAASAVALSGAAQLRQWRWDRHQTSLGGKS